MTASADHESEHERRFLVTEPHIVEGLTGYELEQGYLWADSGYAIRARRQQRLDDEHKVVEAPSMLTIKGPREGFTRWEVELQIPTHRAATLIEIAPNSVTKTRYPLISEGNTWEVDVFHGSNEGLIIAEFEGSYSEVAMLRAPWWCGEEVTQDKRYNNENLAVHPWPIWRAD